MKKKPIFNLTKDQQNKVDVLTWLLSQHPDDLATGRTTLLAMAFLQTALDNPGQWIEVFDHTGTEHDRTLMMMQIEYLCPPQYKEFLKTAHGAIQFYE